MNILLRQTLRIRLWELVFHIFQASVVLRAGLGDADASYALSGASLVGWGVLICGAMVLLCSMAILEAKKHSRASFPMFGRAAITALLLVGIVTIIRSTEPNFKTLAHLFGTAYGAWPYILPVAMYAGRQEALWRRLNRVFVGHTAIGVLLFVIAVVENGPIAERLFLTSHSMLYACGLLLLTLDFQTRLGKGVAVAGVLSLGGVGFMIASRHTVAISFLYILAFCCLSLSTPKLISDKVNFIVKSSLVSVFVASLAWFGVRSCISLDEAASGFEARLLSDTRSFVFEEFWDDMTSWDIIWGRGATGRYYSRYWEGKRRVYDGRENVECGFLQLVLKGGIIMLLLFLASTLPSVFLGLFASREPFAQATAAFVLIYLIDMIPFGLPRANARYCLFWLAVGACWSYATRGGTTTNPTRVSK